MQLAPLICVDDVEVSSRWYQRLLGCTSGHGGRDYDRLNDGDRLIVQLHRWEVEHDHGPLGDPALRPYGNGVLLWFELDDFEGAVARALELNAEILKERRWRKTETGSVGCAISTVTSSCLQARFLSDRANRRRVCESTSQSMAFV